MKLVIVSNAPLIKKNNQWFAYGPYVKEMQIWAKYADEIAFCCPKWKHDNGLLIAPIPFSISKTFLLSDFNIKSGMSAFKAFFQSIYNFWVILKAMLWADHIHLRCPGNVGLLASVAQILFPHKVKTAKYAGNWDPNAKHPLSYRLQKAILSNTFLTRKMNVLVYGQWLRSTKNVKSFFTATYQESDKKEILPRDLNTIIKIVFVGTLSLGKRPLYAIQLIEGLLSKGLQIEMVMYGEGIERKALEKYISDNNLQQNVVLLGNQNVATIQKAYQESHFIVLPSQSEGWPKVIAEGMFWGCVPLATSVSCVPYMVNFGNRGILLDIDLKSDVANIQKLISNEETYKMMALNGMEWSRKYTLDTFEQEIKLLLHS